ncbi:MAG: glycosyltransferase [Terriglobia bacterium]
MPETRLTISVIICSRDRGPSLRETLDSLFTPRNLRAPDWECLLVYYPPDRPTGEIASEYARKFPSRFSPLAQHGAGKSSALNDGIRAARGDILSLTDDDCLCDAGYLEGIREVFGDPQIQAVEGRQLAQFEGKRPGWLGNDLINAMGNVDFGDKLYAMPSNRAWLSGSDMILRRAVFAKTGGFRPDLGAGAGEPGGMAEDVEFSRRVMKAGFTIFYSPQILIQHRLSASRLTRGFFVDRFLRAGRSQAHYVPIPNPSTPRWKFGIYYARQTLRAGARGLIYYLAGRRPQGVSAALEGILRLGFYLEHQRLRRLGISEFAVPGVLDDEGRPLPEGTIKGFAGPNVVLRVKAEAPEAFAARGSAGLWPA